MRRVERALARWRGDLQYRDKSGDARAPRGSADCSRCAAPGVPLIVNDDVELAATVGADGVHLGEHDGASRRARQLGRDAIIGVSCYDSLDRAQATRRRGRRLSGVRRLLSFADQAAAHGARTPACCATRSRLACRWWRSAALRRTMRSR